MQSSTTFAQNPGRFLILFFFLSVTVSRSMKLRLLFFPFTRSLLPTHLCGPNIRWPYFCQQKSQLVNSSIAKTEEVPPHVCTFRLRGIVINPYLVCSYNALENCTAGKRRYKISWVWFFPMINNSKKLLSPSKLQNLFQTTNEYVLIDYGNLHVELHM